jgi:hypothetical protein
MFATVVEARGHYMLESGSVPAVRYRWPQAITELSGGRTTARRCRRA